MEALQTVIPILSTAGHLSVTTASVGTNWTTLGSNPCKQLDVANLTGTTLEFRQGRSGVGFQVPTGMVYTFFALTNTDNLEVRRVDTSNTQVSFTARWSN